MPQTNKKINPGFNPFKANVKEPSEMIFILNSINWFLYWVKYMLRRLNIYYMFVDIVCTPAQNKQTHCLCFSSIGHHLVKKKL